MIKPGSRFYLDELDANCVVIGYIDDDHWWFRLEGTVLPVFKSGRKPTDVYWLEAI